MSSQRWTTSALLAFWFPLALSWMMMTIAQPITAIAISRLPDPEVHLAAYGVTFDLGFLLESPIVMLLSASVALTRDRMAYRHLLRITVWASAVLSGVFAIVTFTPVYDVIVRRLIGVPADVAAQARPALGLLLPWVGAVAWRRFHQGPLIMGGLTRLISVGTVIRLVTLSVVLAIGVWRPFLPGAMLGALALSASVIVEALINTVWALPVVRKLPARSSDPVTVTSILRFCAPLAATDVMRTLVRPAITSGISRTILPVVSLAAWPVASSFIQLLGGAVSAFQEMTVAVIDGRATYLKVRRFVLITGVAVTVVTAVIALTPVIDVFLITVVHLPPALRAHVVDGVRLMIPMPLLFAVRNLFRGVLIQQRSTGSIQVAMIAYVGAMLVGIAVGVQARLAGVTVAALAGLIAQTAEVVVLYIFFRGALRRLV